MNIKVLQCGLGPIGLQITQYLGTKTGLEIVGAVDIDPVKIGTDLGNLAEIKDLHGILIHRDLQSAIKEQKPDVVILTTTSSITKIKSQLMEILYCGINVVSTCEELSYPWRTNPILSKEIDTIAKEKGVSVLATGVNPGFLMDFLPLALTGICYKVKTITVERIQNAQLRRVPFQKKIGAGLTVQQFQEKVKQKTIRHVGLIESLYRIADRMNWTLDRTEETIMPIVAQHQVTTTDFTIEIGEAIGVNQHCHGYRNNEEVISLVFRAAINEPNPHDSILINGTPNIELTINGGINGDVATCAIIVNAIPVVVNASPGLKTMADIKPITYFDEFIEFN